jgi:hypothetical protein
MGFGIDSRIHAHGDSRDLSQARRHPVDALQLRLAFHIEAVNALPESEFYFSFGLADSSEDAFFGIAPRRNHTLEFAAADDVESTAEIG